MSPSPRNARCRRLAVEALEIRLCLATYSLLDLAPPVGNDSSSAEGMGDPSAQNLVVVGSSSAAGANQPTVWQVDTGAATALASVLPGLNAGSFGIANEVNNQGMIAGDLRFDTGNTDGQGNPIYATHVIVWTTDGTTYSAHDLGPGTANSISQLDSNGHAWVVGTVTSTSTCIDAEDPNVTHPRQHAMAWRVDTQGGVLSINNLQSDACDARASDVTIVGQSVLVAGRSDVHGDGQVFSPGEAVVWQLDLGGNLLGRTDLGTLGGTGSYAFGINGQGDAVGHARRAGDTDWHAFLHQDGQMSELGSLGNRGSQALGINDSDVVVGNYANLARRSNEPNYYAFVWESGTMRRLLDQVTDSIFWRLYSANDINSDGEIVGTGSVGSKRDSATHGFLAIPQDDGDNGDPGGGKGGGKGGPKKLLAETDVVGGGARLSQQDAERIATQAMSLWSDALGADSLPLVRVVVADLPQGTLGEAYGRTMTLDVDANGAGWSFDGAASHYDVLTVAAHEIGHLLGYDHSHEPMDVMASTLSVGARRLPTSISATGLTADRTIDFDFANGLIYGDLARYKDSPIDSAAEEDIVAEHHQFRPSFALLNVNATERRRDEYLATVDWSLADDDESGEILDAAWIDDELFALLTVE